MKYRKLLFGLILVTSLTTTAAYAQNITPSPTVPSTSSLPLIIDGDKIKDANGNVIYVKPKGVLNALQTDKLGDPEVWIVLLLTMIAGGLGGLVFELLNLQGNIERRHDPTEDELAAKLAYASYNNVVDLGVWARIIIGVFAAPPTILLIRPESAFALLAMSIVAGSAGTAVFRALQERVLLAIAQNEKDSVEPETPAKKQTISLDMAINAFEKLDQKVRMKSDSKPGTTELTFPNGLILDPKDFKKVRQFLIKAKEVNVVNDKLEEAIKAFDKLEQNLRDVSGSPSGTTELRISKDASLDSKDFDKVKKLLYEAKCVSKTNIPGDKNITSPPKTSEIDPNAKVDEAIKAFTELKAKFLTVSTRDVNSTTMKFANNASIQQEDLDKVQTLLRELKGLFDITSTPKGRTPSPIASQIDSKVKKVVDAFDKIVEKLSKTSVDRWVGSATLQFTERTSLEQAELYEVDTLLYEIKGLQQRISIPDAHTLTQTAAPA